MKKIDTNNLIFGGKYAVLIIAIFVALATVIAVWYGVAHDDLGGFFGWMAGLDLVLQGFGIYKLYKYFFPSKVVVNKEDDEELNQIIEE